jgi:hypothetical protein
MEGFFRDRFPQKLAGFSEYDTIRTPHLDSRLCIIFTRCFDSVRYPNRQTKRTQYQAAVQNFLATLVGNPAQLPLPKFFIHS